MARFGIHTIIGIVPLLLFLGACQAPSDTEEFQAIQAVYDQQSKAFNDRSVSGVLAVCSSGYQNDNAKAHRSERFSDYADRIESFLHDAEQLRTTATIRSAKVHDNEAQLQTDWHFEAMVNATPPDGKRHHFVSDELDADTWIKDPAKGWIKRHTSVSSTVSTLDGEAVP